MSEAPIKSTAVSKITAQQVAAIETAEQRAKRIRAAREAAEAKKQDQPDATMVECRVLPKGDGLISMGEHIGGVGDAYYLRGETFVTAEDIAKALEDRGLCEITGAAQDKAA